ncbi:MAG: cyanophycin synthetase, partial [Microgenomates group bacterium]
ALAMQDADWTVSGSDTDESFITDDILAKRNIKIQSFSDPIPSVDKTIYSAAYPAPLTPGVKGAHTPGVFDSVPLAHALAEFVSDKKVIAVSGVGGKTTTTAMLAAMFHAAGRDVGYYVGTGSIAGLSAPGHFSKEPFFVIEADEYAISKTDKRPKFALLNPSILITTNIIHDHPDIYADESATMTAFSSLISSIKPGGTWICDASDKITAQILSLPGVSRKDIKVIQYGSDHPLYSKLNLSVFGDQNKLDALAAVLAGIEAGLTQSEALSAIQAYKGAGRRQELRGEVLGRLLYDDYGHHPKEIELTVKSFKEHFPNNRIILVFESHTYTRTEALLQAFAAAIKTADLAFIMPIFESAREKGQSHTVTTESFAALIPGATPLTWENAAETIWNSSKPGDLILTMGAGFVYKLHDQFKRFAPARSDLEGSAQPDIKIQSGGKV